MPNNNRKWLYDSLTGRGVNLGTYEQFDTAINDDKNLKWTYDTARSNGFDVGDYDSFVGAMRGQTSDASQDSATSAAAAHVSTDAPAPAGTPESRTRMDIPAPVAQPNAAPQGKADYSQGYMYTPQKQEAPGQEVQPVPTWPKEKKEEPNPFPYRGGLKKEVEQLKEEKAEITKGLEDEMQLIDEYERRLKELKNSIDPTSKKRKENEDWLREHKDAYWAAKQSDEIKAANRVEGEIRSVENGQKRYEAEAARQARRERLGTPEDIIAMRKTPFGTDAAGNYDKDYSYYRQADELDMLTTQLYDQGSKYDDTGSVGQFFGEMANQLDRGSLTLGFSEGSAKKAARDVGDLFNTLVDKAMKSLNMSDGDVAQILSVLETDGKKLDAVDEELKKSSEEIDAMTRTYEDMVSRGDPKARSYGAELQKKIEEHNKIVKEQFNPLYDSVKKAWDSYEKVQAAVENEIQGGLTDGQRELLEAFDRYSEALIRRSDDVSTAAKAGAGAEQSAEFMLDFLLTGGLEKAGTKVATKIATNRLLKKGGVEALRALKGMPVKPGLGLRMATDAFTSLARTSLMFPRNLSAYGDQLTQMSGKDEMGRYQFDRTRQNAALNTALTQYIEYWSEGFGEYFGAAEQALFKSVTKNAPRQLIGSTLKGYRGSIGQFLDHGKFNGMFNEMMEEVVGSTLNSLFGWMSGDRVGDKEAMKEFFAGENLATLALSFLPMSAISASTNTSAYLNMRERYNKGLQTLEPFFKSGAISRNELNQLAKELTGLTPEEATQRIEDMADRARAKNGGSLPADFQQSVMGYLEGEFAMSLRNEEWEDSREKMAVVNAYTATYTNPDPRMAWDLGQDEQSAKEDALAAGFTEEQLDNDSWMLGQEAAELRAQGKTARADALEGYAVAKGASEGLRRGYEAETKATNEARDRNVRDNLDVNGNVVKATINIDGKPADVFVTSSDVTVKPDGTISTPTGDGVVKYRLNEDSKEQTAKADQFSNASVEATDGYIADMNSIYTSQREATYDVYRNEVSPEGKSKAVAEKVGQNVVIRRNGVYQPVKVERMTNGGRNVVISGDKKAIQGIAMAMNMRVPAEDYVEAPVERLWQYLSREEDGSLTTMKTEQEKKEEAKPVQESAQESAVGDIAGTDVPVTVNGERKDVHVLDVNDGKVTYEEKEADGSTKTRRVNEAEFSKMMQEAQAPAQTGQARVTPVSAKNFDPSSIDFDNNYVILHQTGTQNFDSILRDGLHVGSGLNGTTTIANRDTLESILQAQAEGRGHEGSDGLIILQIPKSWANGREVRNLDQIDDILMDRFGDSAIQTVPTDVITHAIATPKESSKASIPVDESTGNKVYDHPSVTPEKAYDELYGNVEVGSRDEENRSKYVMQKTEAARKEVKDAEAAIASAQTEKAMVDQWELAEGEEIDALENRKAKARAEADAKIADAEKRLEEGRRKLKHWNSVSFMAAKRFAQQAMDEKIRQRELMNEATGRKNGRRARVARAKQWEKRTGVNVRIIHKLEDVDNEKSRKSLEEGRKIAGWYDKDTDSVCIYLPNNRNNREIDKTFVHEVVSHKGLEALLGKEEYAKLCDKVWDTLMTDAKRKEYLYYNRHLKGSDQFLQRAAADEFIARLSEEMDLGDNRSLFEKFVDWVKDIIDQIQQEFRGTKTEGEAKKIAEDAARIASREKISRADLFDLLRDSLANFEANKGSAKASSESEGTRMREVAPLSSESLPEELQDELDAKGLVMDGGVVMDEMQDALKQETGYRTPNELDEAASPEVGDVRFSETTMPAWKANYMTYPDAKEHVVKSLENFTERCAADDLVHDAVPRGSYKYGEKSSGGFAGPLRTNIEYIVTFDMDTSCPRSLQYLEYVKKIEREIGRPMTQREMIQLTEMMRVYGQMIPCVYCYCENKRQALKQYYTDFIKARQAVITAKTEEEALAAMYGHSTKKEARDSNDPAVALNPAAYEVFKVWRNGKQRYNPSIAQLWNQYTAERNAVLSVLDEMLDTGKISTNMTDEVIKNRLVKEVGIADKNAAAAVKDIVSEWKWDRIEDRPHEGFTRIDDEDMLYPAGPGAQMRDDVLSLWREMTSYGKSASQAKNVMRYIPYTDELKTLREEQKAYINGMGGLRMHSSNDFRIDYVLDYFQFMADMAVNHMFGHTYTKSPEFVRIFGNSGYKINMSIAAYEDSHGIRPNADEGFDWEEAKRLRSMFPNAGVMLMATSDAQIQLALDSDWIDMFIPFHASGLPKEVWYDMRMWSDYSSKQNERFLNSTEMREELEKDGVEVPKSANAEEVQKLYNEHFNIIVKTYVDSEGQVKRVRPHFLPGKTTVHGIDVPGHGNDLKTYLDLCRQWGVRPRFYGIKVKDNTPEGGGREVDITEHPAYMKCIKETARTDTPQTAIEFNFDQPSEALGGRTPMDYAFEELQNRARAEAESAGGPVRNIYESYKKDIYGIVPQFIKGVIYHEDEYRKRTGEELPLDFLTPDSRKWFMSERKSLEAAYKDVDTIPYHPHEYDENGNLIMTNAEGEPEGTTAEEAAAEESVVMHREVEDPAKIEELENGPQVPAYRAMQFVPDPEGDWEFDLGDGKGKQKGFLYPPMSAQTEKGEWRNPVRRDKWEESEEAPEKAILKKNKKGNKWVFRLHKGNGKYVDAAYNPYIHSSDTMLNDQFSEAQSRGNLVVVKVMIPESELKGDAPYQAEKAKDHVGRHDWKAGPIQGELTGTRTVYLTRWDKPVEIVPVDKVAQEVSDMVKGQVETMPTNVVWPQLRQELEKLGVKFIETDNQGYLVGGDRAGESWKSVYTKKQKQKKSKKKAQKKSSASVDTRFRERQVAANLYDGYENQDGESNPWMSEGELIDRIEEELPYGINTKDIFAKIDEYRRLDKEDFEEGRRDYSGSERDKVFQDILFDLKELGQDTSTRFREANQSQNGFISNAEAALEGIKMDKATPEQWVKMLEKGGGLKAGEDKWLGLSDWLKSQDKKSITKQEIADYIAEHRIQIEEVPYSEGVDFDTLEKEHPGFEDAFELGESAFSGRVVVDSIRDFDLAVEMYNREHDDKISMEDDISDDDYRKLKKYADDLLKEARKKAINETRLKYTTEGLKNKREIALTVPTVDSYEGNLPEVHFNDERTGGKAVAWSRFGDAEGVPDGGVDLERYQTYKGRRDAIERQIAESQEDLDRGVTGMRRKAEETLIEKNREMLAELDKEFADVANVKPGRTLVIDEIQSQRHQDAREKGYKSEAVKRLQEAKDNFESKRKEVREANERYFDATREIGEKLNREEITQDEYDEFLARPEIVALDKAADEKMEAYNAAEEEYKAVKEEVSGTVEDAPFEKNWHELAMKRMLRLAAEEGYDYVAWTTGDQQAERYGIGGAVDKIVKDDDYNLHEKDFTLQLKNGKKQNIVTDDDGKVIRSLVSEFRDKNLSEIVGKEMAEKMLSMKEGETFEGEDLKVGGAGMKGFYDEILPRFMNKYGKKWGVKTGDIALVDLPYNDNGEGVTMHAVPVTPEMKESVMQGQTMFREGEYETRTYPYQGEQSEETQKLFDAAKERFGTTYDIREAGYVLPDGTMLDFSGRHLVDPKSDTSWLRGRRQVDHRDIEDLNYEKDGNTTSGMKTDMSDFIRRGAIRINMPGSINLSVKPTKEQARVLERLINSDPRFVRVDFGDGYSSDHYADYDNTRAPMILSDIADYFDKGIKPEGTSSYTMYRDVASVETTGFGDLSFTHRGVEGANDANSMYIKYNDGSIDQVTVNRDGTVISSANDVKNVGKNIAELVGTDIAEQVMSEDEQSYRGEKSVDTLFREADYDTAQESYENEIRRNVTTFLTEWQDMDIPVRIAVNAVMAEVGMKDLAEDEDYLTRHNLVSSRADAQMHKFKLFCYQPLVSTIGDIEKKLVGDVGKVGRKRKYAEAYGRVRDYIYAVSALERNEWKRNETGEDRDYSGITSLMGRPKEEWREAEDDARAMIDAFKAEVGDDALLDELWDRIRACTDFNLEFAYRNGLLTRAEYERLHGTSSQPRMWNFYVPLRGFSEDTAEDLFSYRTFVSSDTGDVVVKKAKGRSTEADDPIANIRRIAERGVVQALNNWAKRALYNFVVSAGNNSLLTQVEPWYVKDTRTGNWELAEPADGQSLEDFENEMKTLQAKGEAKNERTGLKLGVIMANKAHRNEHMIRLKVAGVDKGIWVNGDPRIASIMNGAGAASNWFTQAIHGVNRGLSQLYTTYSVKFLSKNKQRDTQFSRIAALVNDGQAYLTKLEKNWWVNNGIVAGGYPMMKLVSAWESGKLEQKPEADRTETEQLFIDFMYDGGATGYTVMNSMEKIKKELQKMVENAGKEQRNLSIIKFYTKYLGIANEAVELLTRFTVYQTSRQMGRGRQRSAEDAKESSVNFNRRGLRSGKGFYGWTASAASLLYLFINPAIQGLDKFVRLHKTHPWRMGLVDATYFAMGFVNSMLNAMIAGASDGGDGDDDDEQKMGPDWYWNIPEWVRRSNIIIGSPFKKLGKWGYLVFALPIEYKGFYAMGELVSALMQGKYAAKDAPTIANEVIGVVAELLPVNPVEGYTPGDNPAMSVVRNMMPDVAAPIMDVATNRSFAGVPLWKESVYDESLPLAQTAFASTPEILNKAVIKLSEATATMPWHIDIPSGAVRGLLKGYGGGGYTFVEDLGKFVFADEAHPRRWENAPFVSGFTGHLEEDRRNSFNSDALNRYKELSEDVVRRVRSAAPGEDIKESDVYGDPNELPEKARAAVVLLKDKWILGKMYHDGIKQKSGAKEPKVDKNGNVRLVDVKDDINNLRKAWKKAKDEYLEIAKDDSASEQQKEDARKASEKAWLRYINSEDALVDRLLEEEYNHVQQKIDNGIPYEPKESWGEKAYKLTNKK